MRDGNGSAQQLQEIRKKVEDARVAYAFVNSDIGQRVLGLMQDEVTALLNDVAGGEPLEHDDYIKKQSRIAALRGFMNRMVTDAANKHKWEKVYEQRARELTARLSTED